MIIALLSDSRRSHSAVGTACFEKGGTKGRQGKSEKSKIQNCCTFCLKLKSKIVVCEGSLESLHVWVFFFF